MAVIHFEVQWRTLPDHKFKDINFDCIYHTSFWLRVFRIFLKISFQEMLICDWSFPTIYYYTIYYYTTIYAVLLS